MVKRDFSEFEHNLSDGQIIDLFEDFCISKGLIFTGKESYVVADGKKHYVKVANRSNKNKNSKSGWYRFDLSGDIAKGSCGWFHGDNPCFSWHLYFDYIAQNKNNGSIRFSKADEISVLARKERREEQLIEQQLEERLILNCAKVYTAFEMWRSVPTESHPYTTSKKIDPCYVRSINPSRYTQEELEDFVQSNYPHLYKPELINRIMDWQNVDDQRVFFDRSNILIIPSYDFDMEYRTFQYILPKKSKTGKQKLFLGAQGAKSGSFHLIYDYDLPNPDRHNRMRFIVCEGWATGFALYQLTKGTIPIIVAWDAGNIIPVCRQLRNRYYSAIIYICGDNDHDSFNKNLGMVVNAGYNHAVRAASQVGAVVAIPPFNKDVPEHKDKSDWDDYLDCVGFNNAQEAIRTAMRTPILYANYLNAENESMHQPVKWSERLEYINKYAYPVSTCGFTRYYRAQISAIRFGLNDSLDDIALDSIIRFEIDQQSDYDFSVEEKVDNPARNYLIRHINSLISNLEHKLMQHTEIRSLIPDIHELLKTIGFYGSDLVEQIKNFIFECAKQYNSEIWVENVLGPVFLNIDTPLVAKDIIQNLKENDIFFELPQYQRQQDATVQIDRTVQFTRYWFWYLHLCFGNNVPKHLTNLTLADFKNHINLYIQMNPNLGNLITESENILPIGTHHAVDGSLHIVLNDLHEYMLKENIEDIRFYEDRVFGGFSIFAKIPVLLQIFKQSVVEMFAQNESYDWSQCVVENMWEKFQKNQSE